MQFRQVKVVCILSSSANILFVSPQSCVDVSFNFPMSTIFPCRHSTNIRLSLTRWPTNDFPWLARCFHALHVSQVLPHPNCCAVAPTNHQANSQHYWRTPESTLGTQIPIRIEILEFFWKPIVLSQCCPDRNWAILAGTRRRISG